MRYIYKDIFELIMYLRRYFGLPVYESNDPPRVQKGQIGENYFVPSERLIVWGDGLLHTLYHEMVHACQPVHYVSYHKKDGSIDPALWIDDPWEKDADNIASFLLGVGSWVEAFGRKPGRSERVRLNSWMRRLGLRNL